MQDKNQIIEKKLNDISNPVIVELGVNRGRSTKRFFDHIKLHGGKLFSIDIKDCSEALEDKDWNFFQCNDLHIEKILKKFPDLKNGIDVLFIDSYHDPNHVKSLLLKWFYYIRKNGYIFLDDTESYLYRIKKNLILSIINDAINLEIKNFYHANYHQLSYTKYYEGSGLAELHKNSDMGSVPISKKIWTYNYIFSQFYLLLKKIKFYLFK
tara:strand:- start:2726 stop:3355 length:630 start_codon:yes stop_codon:yes gene_type:complete